MAEAVRAWTTMSLSEAEHDQFMIDWPRTLRTHHEARLDHLLWENRAAEARRMFPAGRRGLATTGRGTAAAARPRTGR